MTRKFDVNLELFLISCPPELEARWWAGFDLLFDLLRKSEANHETQEREGEGAELLPSEGGPVSQI